MQAISLYDKYKFQISEAIDALNKRYFYATCAENPKAYPEDADGKGKNAFASKMNNDFKELNQGESTKYMGEEISPYLQVGLGIKYPYFSADALVAKSIEANSSWRSLSVKERAGILTESLERIKSRFFEIAYATMHTTGQSFLMSFQASGPHAVDRAMEAIAQGVIELQRYPGSVEWKKNMGKFDLVLNKSWHSIPKGIGLVIGCSTFPVWNSVPGIYASLITGNTVIMKPHPKAVLPIAIVIAEIQKVLKENGHDPCICQLAIDTLKSPIAKLLAENKEVKIIDYTGSTLFGKYIEDLKGKTVFTENAGVNSVIIHSTRDVKLMMQNIAFSITLYSGQMCTAPQNIFIPGEGVSTPGGKVSYEECKKILIDAIQAIINNPKAGPPTFGAIQNDQTLARIQESENAGGNLLISSVSIQNPEFDHARTATSVLIELEAGDKNIYEKEYFGPIAFLIKCNSYKECIDLAANMSLEHGAITCLAFCNDEQVKEEIAKAMNSVFTPVSFNFTGAAFVNQHAAFSDFHVTGGNPSGNGTFTNSNYINNRFVWVGNREMN